MCTSPAVLARPTLVLNRSWQPVHVTTVVRSLVMLWNESARVIDPADFRPYGWEQWMALPVGPGDPFIRTSRAPLRVPEVVVLQQFDRLPLAAVSFSRRNVAKRDHFTCQYCGVQPGVTGVTIDHVVPRAQGGPSSWSNCVAACAGCNARKADRTPEQAGMKLRKAPSRPDWKPLYALRELAASHHLESWTAFLGQDHRQVGA
jgi:5-methylcytosine-specific restriction endonuclease McrA